MKPAPSTRTCWPSITASSNIFWSTSIRIQTSSNTFGCGRSAQQSKNICCVGDDDQSIYAWRGAEIDNILKFDKDFPDAKVIRLEQNYRSTAPILAVAGHLIAHNEGRLGKTLWTDQ